MQHLRPHQDLLSQDLYFTNSPQAIGLQREWYIHILCITATALSPQNQYYTFFSSIYVCMHVRMHACMHILTIEESLFSYSYTDSLLRMDITCYLQHQESSTEAGGGAFALTQGTQSLRLSREAVTQRKPPPPTKDSWAEPGCMARPRNPCPLKEPLYLLNERRHLSAVLLGKLDSNLLNLLKAACSLLQRDNAALRVATFTPLFQ